METKKKKIEYKTVFELDGKECAVSTVYQNKNYTTKINGKEPAEKWNVEIALKGLPLEEEDYGQLYYHSATIAVMPDYIQFEKQEKISRTIVYDIEYKNYDYEIVAFSDYRQNKYRFTIKNISTDSIILEEKLDEKVDMFKRIKDAYRYFWMELRDAKIKEMRNGASEDKVKKNEERIKAILEMLK